MRTLLQRITEIIGWLVAMLLACAHFGVLLYFLAIALPIGAIILIVAAMIPFHYLYTALTGEWYLLLYMLIVLGIAVCVVIQMGSADDSPVRRGRRVYSEQEVIERSALRPYSRMNRRKP
jgi:hypothetical protein